MLPVKPIAACPFLAIAIVVKPSGKANPIAMIVKPKKVLYILVNMQINVNKSINNPLANRTHNKEHKIPNKFNRQ